MSKCKCLPYYKDIPSFIPIGFFDTCEILSELNKFTDADWTHFTRGSGHIPGTAKHTSSYTLPVIWAPVQADPTKTIEQTFFPKYEHIKKIIEPLIPLVHEFYPGSQVLRVFFTKMDPWSEIGEHIDTALNNRACRRIHVPVITNQDVIFSIDGVDYHFPINQAFEVNNTLRHGVRNLSDQPRIHLIVDFLPEVFSKKD